MLRRLGCAQRPDQTPGKGLFFRAQWGDDSEHVACLGNHFPHVKAKSDRVDPDGKPATPVSRQLQPIVPTVRNLEISLQVEQYFVPIRRITKQLRLLILNLARSDLTAAGLLPEGSFL